jgi:lipopolysaccharide biosynthesis glycosyltransferase
MSAAARCTTSTICLLIGDQLQQEFVAAAEDAFARLSIPFEYVEADFGDFGSLPLGFHLSRAAYGRLHVPSTARRFASRTLYLDADTLVIGDIAALAETDFGKAAVVAAVRSRLHPTVRLGGIDDWEQRGLDPTAPFFNSGVLLIDNDAWTRRDISAQVVADLRRRPETASFADQGALNSVLYDQWSELPWYWNHEIVRTPAVRVGPFVVSRRSYLAYREVRILHYLADLKPWDARYPPGYLSTVYRRNWEHFLPVPAPHFQSYRQWLRKRYSR